LQAAAEAMEIITEPPGEVSLERVAIARPEIVPAVAEHKLPEELVIVALLAAAPVRAEVAVPAAAEAVDSMAAAAEQATG
jgi:hypothetical protein